MNQDAKGLSTYIPRMSAPSLNTSYQQTEWYKVSVGRIPVGIN